MPPKDPLSYQVFTYFWVIGMASWGGLASYVQKIKVGHCRFSISELIGEICISGFVGIVTFFLCEAAHIDQIYSAFFIGITGHMGSRAIFILEKLIDPLLKRWLGARD